MCLSSFLLALFAKQLDELYHSPAGKQWPKWLIYQGDVEGARTLLSTVAGSMITVAGVSFSITMVALSLASSQFGPRLLMNFMRDTGNQIVLGTFVSTFLYCLLTLGNGSGVDGTPPAASASVGLLLAVLSVFVLIYFIHHVSSTIRAEHVVQVVAKDTIASIKRLVSPEDSEHQNKEVDPSTWPAAEVFSVCANESGYLQAIDEPGLQTAVESLDAVIKLERRPGKFVTAGEALATIHAASWHRDEAQKYHRYFIIGYCRTDDQDPEYGISQLVEVAVRALSPGINDPHTAISCIDWLASGLRQIASEPLCSAYRWDKKGKIRLIREAVDFQGLLNAAFDQIRQNSKGMPSVSIHLLEALSSIQSAVVDEDRKRHVTHQAQLVVEGAEESNWQSRDIEDLKQRFKNLLAIEEADSPHPKSTSQVKTVKIN